MKFIALNLELVKSVFGHHIYVEVKFMDITSSKDVFKEHKSEVYACPESVARFPPCLNKVIFDGESETFINQILINTSNVIDGAAEPLNVKVVVGRLPKTYLFDLKK